MASTQPAQRRAGLSDDIENWMASRRADLERLGSSAEAAGRNAWNQATRSGRNLVAAQPSDVIALGDRSLREQGDGPPQADGAPVRFIESDAPQKIEGPVQAATRPDFDAPKPMDLGFRFVQAQPGDSISRLVGASDPRAIGRFQSLNGMNGGGPALRAGRSYFVPTHWDDASADEVAAGRGTLRSDNARLTEIAQRKAEGYRQAQLLANDRNAWTGEPVDPTDPPAMPAGPSGRTWLDDSKAAKLAGGTLAYTAGLVPGAARGAWNTVKGAAEGAVFAHRLTDPLDMLISPPGQSAWEQAFKVGRSGVDLAKRYHDDPSLIGDDLAQRFDDFRRQNDPTATPMADTFGGELHRDFNFGLNHGEMAFDGASLLVGGEALRGAAGMGAAAKAADATELAYLARRPGLAAYFEQPYSGMSHHILARSTKLPQWLGGDPIPKALMESDFNKIRYRDMSRRDLFRNHVGVDEHYWGGKVGREFGSGGWSGKKLGWGQPYGPLDRLNYGTSPATKAVVGAGLFGGTSDDLTSRWANP